VVVMKNRKKNYIPIISGGQKNDSLVCTTHPEAHTPSLFSSFLSPDFIFSPFK